MITPNPTRTAREWYRSGRILAMSAMFKEPVTM